MDPQHGGEPCEEVHEAKSCNLQSCDKDCELSDWTAWSDCSKACNRGSSERVKTIVTPLEGGGTCPALRSAERVQTRKCNEKPCQNAMLGYKCFKFTPTKLRNNRRANSVQFADIYLRGGDKQLVMRGNFKAKNPGGRSPRREEPFRAVDENPRTKFLDFRKGPLIIESKNGPVEASHFRFTTANDATERDPVGWKFEGSKDCKKYELLHSLSKYRTPTARFSPTQWFPFPAQPLRCGSDVDVILAIDGGGSLGEPGWKATQTLANNLAESFMAAGKVQLAISLFSSQLDWVQHFSSDKDKTLSNIKDMEWPKGAGTKTSEALDSAVAELSLGRQESKSVVIVLTDSKPLSPKKTQEAAERLRKGARLMFVPVTQFSLLAEFKQLVSYPKEDNLFPMPHFQALMQPTTTDTIVSSVCHELY
eukprot:TRINITY_DN339_c1_g1_i3.p1 TRINITY_DN339_c1_g1~~TRINITY_DN339_c1_g1_i3.p1  ORF type:complete len:459 (+),score=149.06 TRINITY_DN339_c1_g1_i3:116-1378(+)